LIVRASRAALEGVDPRLVEAARVCGASPWGAFFGVTLPLARGGVLAGVTLGFARALGDFGATLMVAGNLPGLTQTAPLSIYDAVQAGREGEAAGMAALLTAFAVAALVWSRRLAPPSR
jgi:molybdate transport system permease protein